MELISNKVSKSYQIWFSFNFVSGFPFPAVSASQAKEEKCNCCNYFTIYALFKWIYFIICLFYHEYVSRMQNVYVKVFYETNFLGFDFDLILMNLIKQFHLKMSYSWSRWTQVDSWRTKYLYSIWYTKWYNIQYPLHLLKECNVFCLTKLSNLYSVISC